MRWRRTEIEKWRRKDSGGREKGKGRSGEEIDLLEEEKYTFCFFGNVRYCCVFSTVC